MNKLNLCKRLRQEAGIAGLGPDSTIGQKGELRRIVDWIDAAYQDIQDKHDDWEFLRDEFSFDCVVGTDTYAASTVENLANWRLPSVRIYLTTLRDERWLNYIPWNLFRDTRRMQSNRFVEGRPINFSIKPDKSMVLWPIPDETYTIEGEFYRVPYTMDVDTDTPIIPERYHLAIVYNALMKYAAYIGEPSLYANAQKDYGRLINKLEIDRAPRLMAGPALA